MTILLKFSVLTSLLNVACELSQTMSKTEFPKITSASEVRNICRKSTKRGLAFDYIIKLYSQRTVDSRYLEISRPLAKAYSVILKTVSIRRRDDFLSVFFRKKIVTTSGILRAFVLFSACNMDKFKDFEIKSSVSFK